MGIGSLTSTIFMSFNLAKMSFALRALFSGLATIQACFLSPELEKNERATVKDKEMLLFEQK